jgi:hypothetical protein
MTDLWVVALFDSEGTVGGGNSFTSTGAGACSTTSTDSRTSGRTERIDGAVVTRVAAFAVGFSAWPWCESRRVTLGAGDLLEACGLDSVTIGFTSVAALDCAFIGFMVALEAGLDPTVWTSTLVGSSMTLDTCLETFDLTSVVRTGSRTGAGSGYLFLGAALIVSSSLSGLNVSTRAARDGRSRSRTCVVRSMMR